MPRGSSRTGASYDAVTFGASGLSTSTTTTTQPQSTAPTFAFFPQGGNPYGDLLFSNFVDVDSSSGRKDYSCGFFTYNGHQGIDSSIRTFSEQRIGVPIFAVADGVVLAAVDVARRGGWLAGEPRARIDRPIRAERVRVAAVNLARTHVHAVGRREPALPRLAAEERHLLVDEVA